MYDVYTMLLLYLLMYQAISEKTRDRKVHYKKKLQAFLQEKLMKAMQQMPLQRPLAVISTFCLLRIKKHLDFLSSYLANLGIFHLDNTFHDFPC